MVNSFDYPGDYWIEISGWGLDNSFFAERTELLWTTGGEKLAHLHRALPEGATVFIRLLASELSSGSVPVAYQVEGVAPMDRYGRCQVRLEQLHPRMKESSGKEIASKVLEDSQKVCNVLGYEEGLQREEILQ